MKATARGLKATVNKVVGRATKQAAQKSARYVTTRGEYNGRPTLTIKDTQANPRFSEFSFGLSKARMIVAAIDEIREFVAENEKE